MLSVYRKRNLKNSGSATDDAEENVWLNSNYITPNSTPTGRAPRKAPPTPSEHQREVMRPRIWGGGRLHYHAECRSPRYWMTSLWRPWRLDGGRDRGGRRVRARAGGDGRSRRSRRGADRMFLFLCSFFLFLSFGGEGRKKLGSPTRTAGFCGCVFLLVILYFITRNMRPEGPWPWQRRSRCPKPASGGYLTISCPCPA